MSSGFLLLFVLTFVIGLRMYTSYKKRQAAAEWQPTGIPVKILEVQPTDLDEVVEATGIIRPYREVTIYPEVSGEVTAIEADLGDYVEKDAPIVRIDDELIRLKIRQIRAQITKLSAVYADAEKNLKRLDKLYKQNTVSETERDQALLATQTNQGMLDEAQAALDMALYELRHATVSSPIAGKVAQRFLEVGSLASPQTPVARIVNIGSVKVEMGLIDEEIRRVHVGQEVAVQVDAFPEKIFIGRVTAVGTQADSHTLTFPVRVELDNTEPEDQLLPGMIAKLSIKVKQNKNVIVVPREIVREEGDRHFVFVVTNSMAMKRFLTLGANEKEKVIVTSGLKPGHKVVMVGHEILDNGMKVQIDTGKP